MPWIAVEAEIDGVWQRWDGWRGRGALGIGTRVAIVKSLLLGRLLLPNRDASQLLLNRTPIRIGRRQKQTAGESLSVNVAAVWGIQLRIAWRQ